MKIRKKTQKESLFFTMSDPKKRACCISHCENVEQLVNTRCEACEHKVYPEKHYMCLTCYIQYVKSSFHRKIPITCPLDRSHMYVEPDFLMMCETQTIMEKFFDHLNIISAATDAIRDQILTSPVRVAATMRGEPQPPSRNFTDEEIMESSNYIRRRQGILVVPQPPVVEQASPRGVDTIDSDLWSDARQRQGVMPFPQISDFLPVENVDTTNRENIPPTPPVRADASHPSWDTTNREYLIDLTEDPSEDH